MTGGVMATVSEFILDAFQRTTFSDGKATSITRTYGTLSNNMSDNLDPNFALEASLENEDFFGQLFSNKPPSAKIEKFWHFPVWPPDAFAVASALLERSGAYTRLTPHYIHVSVAKGDLDSQLKALDDKQNFFRWGHIGRRSRNFTTGVDVPPNAEHKKLDQHKKSEEFIANHVSSLRHGRDGLRPLDSQFDPFGVLGGNQLELRLAGALWANGAVYLSQPLIDADLNPPTVDRPTNQAAANVLIALHDIVMRTFKQLDERYPRTGQTTWRDISQLIVEGYKKDNRHKDPFANYRMLATRGKEKQPRKPFTVSESHVSYMYNAITKLHLQLAPDDNPTVYDQDVEALIAEIQIKRDASLRATGNEIIHSYLLCKWVIDYIQARWSFLLLAEDPVSSELNSIINADHVDWCAPCFRFLILADEASISLGFGEEVKSFDDEVEHATDIKRMRAVRQKARLDRKLEQNYIEGDSLERLEHLEYSRLFPRTLCDRFNSDYGSVLPKSRTPQVGCTLRSYSHHLAFLPPKGRVRGRWLTEDRKYVKSHTKSTVELLLIPYPYAFRSSYLKRRNSCTDGYEHLSNWGWFEVEQGWNERIKKFSVKRPLSPDEKERCEKWGGPEGKSTDEFHGLAALVDMLRSSAEFDIDGVVFPELSLDHEQYEHVSNYLLHYATHPERVFLVGGIALEDQPPQSATILGNDRTPMQNSVVMAFNHRHESEPKWEGRRWDIEWAREKHHRWKLDEWQLNRYALSHRLDPSMVWWEDLAIKSREVGFMEFHPGSIATALICEDLARIEPAQIAIRSVGPNLVFVLLMDGPQIPNRWSNQYAGVLADDPGSSVLTMSSMGLIHRANIASGSGPKSRSFALWRDQLGGVKEIALPGGYHAVNITLKRTNVQEQTMDIRDDPGDTTGVWTLVGINPIRIGADETSISKYTFHETIDGEQIESDLGKFKNAFSFEG